MTSTPTTNQLQLAPLEWTNEKDIDSGALPQSERLCQQCGDNEKWLEWHSQCAPDTHPDRCHCDWEISKFHCIERVGRHPANETGTTKFAPNKLSSSEYDTKAHTYKKERAKEERRAHQQAHSHSSLRLIRYGRAHTQRRQYTQTPPTHRFSVDRRNVTRLIDVVI